jgi:hypothetical protein
MNMPGLDQGAWIYLHFGMGLIRADSSFSKAKCSECDSSGKPRAPESCQAIIAVLLLVMALLLIYIRAFLKETG